KVRLDFVIVWMPLWILAAAIDHATVNLPWLVFAAAARLWRGQTEATREADRGLGCWIFGDSLLARQAYASLSRLRSHRELLDKCILLLGPTLVAAQNAALAETLNVLPQPVAKEPSPVSGKARLRWWAPRLAVGVYFLLPLFALAVPVMGRQWH